MGCNGVYSVLTLTPQYQVVTSYQYGIIIVSHLLLLTSAAIYNQARASKPKMERIRIEKYYGAPGRRPGLGQQPEATALHET